MTTEVTIALAAIFLAAVPLNVWVAREVRRLARLDPPIDILSLLSLLVNILALIASVLGIIAFASIVTLTTAIRLIPVPGSTVALIGVLLAASTANIATWLWLRGSRSAKVGPATYRLRDTLRANLFDGDEAGTVTMPITRLLDQIVEVIEHDFIVLDRSFADGEA